MLPHLLGVPHLHVNRPLVEKNVCIRNNNNDDDDDGGGGGDATAEDDDERHIRNLTKS